MLKNKFLLKQNVINAFVLSIITLFCLHRLFFIKTGVFENVISYTAYPVVLFQGKLSNFFNNYNLKNQTVEKLITDLECERNEKEELLRENIQLKSSLGYLEQVKELIEFRKRYNLNSSMTAQIIMKQIANNNQICFIDKGSNAGITKDMIAIYKNCLLGRVIEVYPTYSKIIYITDKLCKVAAYCFKTGAIGIHNGLNQTNVTELKYVNHLSNLIEDDFVISSGEGLIFPQGYVLGKITKFTKDGIEYKVNVKPLIDIQSINFCQLIKK